MAKEKAAWMAIVVAQNEETGVVISSLLTVRASNRFGAQVAVTRAVHRAPDYVRPDGTPRPFRFVELRQVRERQLAFCHAAFVESFQSTFADNVSYIHTDSA